MELLNWALQLELCERDVLYASPYRSCQMRHMHVWVMNEYQKTMLTIESKKVKEQEI